MSSFSGIKNSLLAEQVEEQLYEYITKLPLKAGVSKPGPVMESRLTTWVMPSTSLISSHRSLTWVAEACRCIRVTVGVGDVGLDVVDGGAVHQVCAPHNEHRAHLRGVPPPIKTVVISLSEKSGTAAISLSRAWKYSRCLSFPAGPERKSQ